MISTYSLLFTKRGIKISLYNRALIVFFSLPGNVFVIAAIMMERHLRSVANYLIVSLAVADLMVACLVMPLGAVYEVRIIIPTHIYPPHTDITPDPSHFIKQ